MHKLLIAAVLALFLPAHPAQDAPAHVPTPAELELQARLAEQSIHLDVARRYCAFPIEVAVRDDLLEYLLVGPAGASHESAFSTPLSPSVLNVALLALGASPGTNADWRPKDPLPSDEQIQAGVSPYEVTLPAGDGLYIYVGWRRGDETYFYRVEDLLRNLLSGQAMSRSTWVYLGSQQVPRTPKSGPDDTVFAAEIYRNLINVAFFREGFTLLTGALPECVEQSIWMLNAWLVPDRGARLTMFFARTQLDGDLDHVRKQLAELPAAATGR